MLVSKIKEIRNGRVIVKDSKTSDDMYDYKGFHIEKTPNGEFKVWWLRGGYGKELVGTTTLLSQAYNLVDKGLRDSKTRDGEAEEAEKRRDEEREKFGDSRSKDDHIDLLKTELKKAEADLAKAKAKGDANWIREASDYVDELNSILLERLYQVPSVMFKFGSR